MEWAANACICWRRRRHRQRDAEEKEREEAERRLEAGRGRTTRAMGMTLKTTHCELEGEGQRRKRGDRNDDAASAGGKRRQRGDEDGEQRGEQTASGARCTGSGATFRHTLQNAQRFPRSVSEVSPSASCTVPSSMSAKRRFAAEAWV